MYIAPNSSEPYPAVLRRSIEYGELTTKATPKRHCVDSQHVATPLGLDSLYQRKCLRNKLGIARM
jgi:hypothetical protein